MTLWTYEKEDIGMGDFIYRISRNKLEMACCETKHQAMIICNGLNRDEARS